MTTKTLTDKYTYYNGAKSFTIVSTYENCCGHKSGDIYRQKCISRKICGDVTRKEATEIIDYLQNPSKPVPKILTHLSEKT